MKISDFKRILLNKKNKPFLFKFEFDNNDKISNLIKKYSKFKLKIYYNLSIYDLDLLDYNTNNKITVEGI